MRKEKEQRNSIITPWILSQRTEILSLVVLVVSDSTGVQAGGHTP